MLEAGCPTFLHRRGPPRAPARRFQRHRSPQPGIDAGHVNHRRISLPMGSRVAVERRIDVSRIMGHASEADS
jgi:hypothetical protein